MGLVEDALNEGITPLPEKKYDLSLLGLNVVPTTALAEAKGNLKPMTNLYGSGNIKDVIALLCGLVNTAARRSGYTAYLGLLPDVFPAVAGFKEIPNEVLDLTEDEITDLKNFAAGKLDLPGTNAEQIEVLATGILYHALGLFMVVVTYFRNVKAVKPL